jgi:hypothetical protein
MTIIPEVSLTELKKLKADQLKQLKCCHVLSDGVYLFTFVNPQTDYVKLSVENLGQLSNSVGGKDPKEI